MRHTEKALREALKFYAACVGVEGEEAFLDDRGEKARAALALPETQGEPVGWLISNEEGDDDLCTNPRALHRFHYKGGDPVPLCAAPSSQPAQGEAATEKLQKLDAIIQETRDYLDMVEMLSEEPDLDRSDTLRLLGVLNDYRAMLAAAPAAPPVPKTPAQEGERKWRAFTWPNGEGEPPLVCLRHGMADITPPCRKWCGSASCTPPTQAKPTNGEGA